MIPEAALQQTVRAIGCTNRKDALSMASFLAESLRPEEQRALLGDAPWVFRKLLGTIGARRMRRFRPLVQTPSIRL